MKKLTYLLLIKKVLIMTMSLIMTTVVLCGNSAEAISKIRRTTSMRPIKVGVLIYSSDIFGANVVKSLEDIQRENPDKFELTIFNSEGNLIKQNELLQKMLDSDYQLILANISGKMEPNEVDEAVYKAKKKNIPLIFFNSTPIGINTFKSYPKAVIINNDSKQAGIMQGKMIADFWSANKKAIDKNGDDILQYIMIKGTPHYFATEDRTKYSIVAINEAGIKTQELAQVTGNWSKEEAQNAIEPLFLGYDGKIEAIIANNDAMAMGAVLALQKYGYNMGDKTKNIPVFGVNGVPEAQDLIEKGFMHGSVFQNPRNFANGLYTVGINLLSDKNPLDGTNYKFDETGVVIITPFEKIIVNNESSNSTESS